PIRSSPVPSCPIRASSRPTRTLAGAAENCRLDVRSMLALGTQADRAGLKQNTFDKTRTMIKQKGQKKAIRGGLPWYSDCALHCRVPLSFYNTGVSKLYELTGFLQIGIAFGRRLPEGDKEINGKTAPCILAPSSSRRPFAFSGGKLMAELEK